MRFLKAYIKTMRLYYAFLTGIAGWIGVAFYDFTTLVQQYPGQIPPTTPKRILILLFLFCVWGINQVVNDYLGLPEDRINAPERPMVTGELNAKTALLVSFCLMAIVGLVTVFYLEPIALIPMLVGLLLNVIYEYAKAYGVWGNIVFGVMIACCTIYGFLASGPYLPPLITPPRISVFLLVATLNASMTYFTYFKDYEGDKQAGKKTIVVKYGVSAAKKIGLVFSIVPTILFLIMVCLGIFTEFSREFIFLAILAAGLQIYTGFLYYKYPSGEKTYFSLKTNFRACICSQATLIALFWPSLGMVLFLLSYIFVGFLFDLVGNVKA